MSLLPARFRALVVDLQAELRANRRLAALLLLIPGVVLVYLCLLVGDAIANAQADQLPLAKRAARLQTMAHSGDWQARIDAAEALLARHEALAWRARSAELAAADLQTALRRLSAEHFSWSRLKLAPAEPVEAIDGWRVRAEINGKLKEDSVLGILQAIGEHQPRILVEQLNVARQRGQTVSLQLGVVVLRGELTP